METPNVRWQAVDMIEGDDKAMTGEELTVKAGRRMRLQLKRKKNHVLRHTWLKQMKQLPRGKSSNNYGLQGEDLDEEGLNIETMPMHYLNRRGYG